MEGVNKMLMDLQKKGDNSGRNAMMVKMLERNLQGAIGEYQNFLREYNTKYPEQDGGAADGYSHAVG